MRSSSLFAISNFAMGECRLDGGAGLALARSSYGDFCRWFLSILVLTKTGGGDVGSL